MAQDYDNMAKNLLTDYATEISQFVLGMKDVKVICRFGKSGNTRKFTMCYISLRQYSP